MRDFAWKRRGDADCRSQRFEQTRRTPMETLEGALIYSRPACKFSVHAVEALRVSIQATRHMHFKAVRVWRSRTPSAQRRAFLMFSPRMSPENLKKHLTSTASRDKIRGGSLLPGTPNLLLYVK